MQTDIDRFFSHTEIPTLPLVAQKLIELCLDDNANFADFAQVIAYDPGLASRILRVANSAYYGMRQQVTTLERAVSALGIKYVKSVALGFELATAVNHFAPDQFDMQEYWRQCVFRSVLARQLTKRYCPEYQEEAFLIGLLLDSGIPLLAQIYGEEYGRLWNENKYSPSSLYQMEWELFELDHVMAASILVKSWSLPDLLAHPIQGHHSHPIHQSTEDAHQQLCQISYFVGSLPLNNPESVCQQDLTLFEYGQGTFGMKNADFEELLEESRRAFSNVSQLFSEFLPGQTDVIGLLALAKSLLSRYNDEANYQLFDCQSELQKLKEQKQKTIDSTEPSNRPCPLDDLTGLTSRSALLNYLNDACQRVQADETNLTVIFLDVDNFKTINDNYSHAAGDRTLIVITKLLKSFFQNKGYLARYGGDEFIVALLGLKAKQAIFFTKQLTKGVRQLKIPVRSQPKGETINITASIGMVFCEAGSRPGNGSRLLELADHQMYHVKKNGKDGIKYTHLSSNSDTNSSKKEPGTLATE